MIKSNKYPDVVYQLPGEDMADRKVVITDGNLSLIECGGWYKYIIDTLYGVFNTEERAANYRYSPVNELKAAFPNAIAVESFPDGSLSAKFPGYILNFTYNHDNWRNTSIHIPQLGMMINNKDRTFYPKPTVGCFE